MKHRDFSVNVLTSHGKIPEYPSKCVSSNNTVAAYVPSRVGERFSIAVENHSLNDATCIFYVDGQMASVLMCHAKPKYYMVNCQGVQPQPGILRRFIDEDEPVETSDKGSSQVGVIRVVIRRCVVLTYDATATYLQFNSASAIHEKSQKGMLDTKTEYSLVESSNVDWETKNNTKPDPMQTYSISITVSHGPSFRLLINRWVHLEMTLILDLLAAMGVAPKIQSGESTFGPKRARPETSEEDSILQENKRLKVEVAKLRRQQTAPLEMTTVSSGGFKTTKRTVKKEIEVVDLTGD